MKSDRFDLPFFEEWLGDKKNLADSTIFTYSRSVKRFLARNPDIDKVEDYNNFLVDLVKKKRSNHYYSALRAFIEYKIGDSNIRKKLIDGMLKPVERFDIKRQRQYLNEDKILEVITYLQSDKHRVLALVQHLTGVRAGDIMRLKRGSIFYEEYKGELAVKLNIVGKGGKPNVVYVHDKFVQNAIINYVTTYFNHDEYYFLELGKMKNREGQKDNEDALIRMNYLWYWQDLKQALQTAGINRELFATHDFKRCFGRRAWMKYKDIHILQGLLRHVDPKITLKYLDQSGLRNIDYHYDMQK